MANATRPVRRESELKSKRERSTNSPVDRARFTPLPSFTPDRLLDRVAEAMQVAGAPEKFGAFPRWTQRVMLILKEQFVPAELEAILSADHSVFVEGIAVALAAGARNLAPATSNGGHLAQKLADRLAMAANDREVAAQVGSGTFAVSAEFQAQVMTRLFAAGSAERRAFIEGLTIGSRLPELLDAQAKRGTTDATGIYLMLWLYWPEIAQLNSIGEVARALHPFFAANKNSAGAHWDERIRKLANRIGLSFRARQTRRRKPIHA
jgi:hypothetical protein